MTSKAIDFLLERDGPLCIWCGHRLEEYGLHEATVDHLFPKSQGGSRDGYNVVLACRGCNNSRGRARPHVYASKLLHRDRLVNIACLRLSLRRMEEELMRRKALLNNPAKFRRQGQLNWTQNELKQIDRLAQRFNSCDSQI